MKKHVKTVYATCLALAAFVPAISSADGAASGKIAELQSYHGHSGLLVRLSAQMPNPDGCPSNSWYIFPDNSARAQFVQAMLLTAYEARDQVNVAVSGCYENYPRILTTAILGK